MSNEIALKLTEDEAWVLFEFVRRYSDTDRLSIEDQAEQRALWNLCCVFEKTLHQTQDVGYNELIATCRNRLRDEAVHNRARHENGANPLLMKGTN